MAYSDEGGVFNLDMKHSTQFGWWEMEEEESAKSRLGIIDSETDETDDDDVETYYDTTEDDDSDSDEDVFYNTPLVLNTEI